MDESFEGRSGDEAKPEAESAPAPESGKGEPASEPVAPPGTAGEPGPGADDRPGETMIRAQGLTKYYGEFTAIEDVSFEVCRGQVVAFLGPNGAGKSTTMRILTGVLVPDRGTAEIAGLSVTRDRLEVARRIGYLPENGPLYDDMTPNALLHFFAEARGLDPAQVEDRIAFVVEQLELGTVFNKLISKLSKGYRQRVGLAQALLHDPDVLILDEPTSGLDPNQIRAVRETISNLGKTKAVLLSTHILQEVEAVADRVVFIHEGRIAFDGSYDRFRERGPTLDEVFAALAPVRAA